LKGHSFATLSRTAAASYPRFAVGLMYTHPVICDSEGVATA
jgi:hypothetical protein